MAVSGFERILAREFRKASGAKRVKVDASEDEVIRIVADGRTYVMEVGSDDDEFVFAAADGTCVRFPFPDDLEA